VTLGVLGTGNVGSTLGRRFAELGHDVIYGSRDPASRRVAELLDGHPGSARAETWAACASAADMLLLAVPWAAVESVLAGVGDLGGRILIDATNPLRADLSGLAVAGDDSGGETVARLARGARVVKAFNTVGTSVMANPCFGERRALLTVAGDDDDARAAVVELAAALGFEAVDFGPLAHARYAEAMAMGWIFLAFQRGFGTDFAMTIARR